jgi:hypothetical protein
VRITRDAIARALADPNRVITDLDPDRIDRRALLPERQVTAVQLVVDAALAEHAGREQNTAQRKVRAAVAALTGDTVPAAERVTAALAVLRGRPRLEAAS